MTREIRNAIITRATIEIEDHGILTSFIHLDYGGSGQGFGGYSLYQTGNETNVAGIWLKKVLEIVQVDSWSDLTGKTVRADADWSKVHRIGHIVKDIWFCPAEEFQND